MIAMQAGLNMGVAMGLLPTKGMPLPFISSGNVLYWCSWRFPLSWPNLAGVVRREASVSARPGNQPAPCDGPVHFVGIGGYGMSALAELALDRGLAVQGTNTRLRRRPSA